MFMRFPPLAVLATAIFLTGCIEESPLDDTLMSPPGMDIQYLGKSAKLYGSAKCVQGQLSGYTCLIFPPDQPKAQATIISGQRAYEVQLSVRKDPQNPVYYIIEDQKGQHVVTSTGRHDEYGNIDIRPVELGN